MTRPLRTIAAAAALTAAASCAQPAPAGATDCTAPTTAAGWQTIADQLPYAGDGNWSTALPDGRAAWVTGDSIPRAGGPWASNTVTVVNGSCTWQTPNAAPDSAGRVFWPGPVTVVRGQLVSVGSTIRRTPGVGLGFEPVGSTIATWTVPAGGWTPQLVRLSAAPASPQSIRWSAGVWTDGVTVYVWGTTDGRPGQWGVDAYLARVPAGSFPVGAWSYWTGSTWSASSAAARPVLTAAAGDGTDTAFTASRDTAGTWRLYTRRGGAWGAEHGVYAGKPGGVWSWSARGTDAGYLAAEHPEVRLVSGRRLVTVNVAGAGVRFLEVPR